MSEQQKPTFDQIIKDGMGADMGGFQEMSRTLPIFTGELGPMFTELHNKGGLVRVIGASLHARPGAEQVDTKKEFHGRMLAFPFPDAANQFVLAVPKVEGMDLCLVGQQVSPDGEEEDRDDNRSYLSALKSNFEVSGEPLVSPLWHPAIGVSVVDDFANNSELFSAKVISIARDVPEVALHRFILYAGLLKQARERQRSNEEHASAVLGVDVYKSESNIHADQFKAWAEELAVTEPPLNQ